MKRMDTYDRHVLIMYTNTEKRFDSKKIKQP